MGYVSFKTLCKGTAILFFVILQGLKAQDSSTTENISESTVITITYSTPTTQNVSESTVTTISSSTESQTSSTPTTQNVSESTVTTISSSTESQTSSTPTTPNVSESTVITTISSTESQTSYPPTTPNVSESTVITTTSSTESQTSTPTKPDVIGNLTTTDITTSSICLTWDKPLGNIYSFRVQWTVTKSFNTTTTTNNTYCITYLIPGVNYTFIITAVRDNVTEGKPINISKFTKPDVIKNLNVSNITTSSVVLKWDEPSGNRSFFIINWMVNNISKRGPKDTFYVDKSSKNVTVNDSSYCINELSAGVRYACCVTAVAADSITKGEAVCESVYTKQTSTTPIVGIVLGLLCILFTVTLIIFFYLRRKTKENCTEIPVHTIRGKMTMPLSIEDYKEYFKQKHADSNCGFAEEYEDLKPVGTAQPKNAALAIENKTKNRYTNVLPYDASRVKLSICGSPFDDYINANYIPGYNSRKEFIAAQGPLPVTVNEFWRMIWEKNVYTIVMLTRCNEQGRVKCEKYWPSGTNHYHNISVTTTSEIPMENWTIRDFTIKNVKTAETRAVRHFHFTAWPDHGVPETTELLIDFRHLVREHMDQYSLHSPSVVHCSAGVGRTGTFIAIDCLIFQIERESKADVYGIVNDMRIHRPLMVQTEEQYVYLHQCAFNIIRSRTGNNVDLIYQNTEALDVYENLKFHKY